MTNLKSELVKLLVDIPGGAYLRGEVFKRMVQGVMDKCEDAPPQGLVDALREWHNRIVEHITFPKLYTQLFNDILSRYKTPATDKLCPYWEGRCNLFKVSKNPSEDKLRKELKNMAGEWYKRCNTDLEYAAQCIKRALAHNTREECVAKGGEEGTTGDISHNEAGGGYSGECGQGDPAPTAQDGISRAKMAAIVFHAAGRPLTEEENMKIIDMAVLPCEHQKGLNCTVEKCPYHETRGTDSDGICYPTSAPTAQPGKPVNLTELKLWVIKERDRYVKYPTLIGFATDLCNKIDELTIMPAPTEEPLAKNGYTLVPNRVLEILEASFSAPINKDDMAWARAYLNGLPDKENK